MTVNLPKSEPPRSTGPGPLLEARLLPLAGAPVKAKVLNLDGNRIVGDLCWSNDGRSFFALDAVGVLRRIALEDFREERRLVINSACAWLSASKAGLLVSVSDLQEAWVIDPASLQVTRRVAAPGAWRVVSSPRLDVAVAAGPRRGLTAIDLLNDRPPREFPNLPSALAVVSPDGKYVFAEGGVDQLFRIRIDGQDLTEEQSTERLAQKGQGIHVSPDGRYVCLPSQNGNQPVPAGPGATALATHIFSVDDLKKPAWTIVSGPYPRAVGFDPRGGFFFAQNAQSPLLLYDYATGVRRKVIRASGPDRLEPLQFLAHSDGGKLLIRTDKAVVFADLTGLGQPLARKGGGVFPRMDAHGPVDGVALSPDGDVVVAAVGTFVRYWEVDTGRELGQFALQHSAKITSVDYSPDGQYVATGSADGHARVWNANAAPAHKTVPKKYSTVWCVRFSPGGELLAVHSGLGLDLVDADTGQERVSMKGVKGTSQAPLANVAFSHDGKLLAAGDGPSGVKIWDAATGALRKTLTEHKRQVLSVEFSPDGKLFASAGLEGTVLLWDARTFEPLASLRGHAQPVLTVVFSPDGKLLSSGSLDGWLKVWDVTTHERIAQLPENNAGKRFRVPSATFSRDGNVLASGWYDNSVRLWDVRKLLEKARKN
jgi:WD40 repeat protein